MVGLTNCTDLNETVYGSDVGLSILGRDVTQMKERELGHHKVHLSKKQCTISTLGTLCAKMKRLFLTYCCARVRNINLGRLQRVVMDFINSN